MQNNVRYRCIFRLKISAKCNNNTGEVTTIYSHSYMGQPCHNNIGKETITISVLVYCQIS